MQLIYLIAWILMISGATLVGGLPAFFAALGLGACVGIVALVTSRSRKGQVSHMRWAFVTASVLAMALGYLWVRGWLRADMAIFSPTFMGGVYAFFIGYLVLSLVEGRQEFHKRLER